MNTNRGWFYLPGIIISLIILVASLIGCSDSGAPVAPVLNDADTSEPGGQLGDGIAVIPDSGDLSIGVPTPLNSNPDNLPLYQENHVLIVLTDEALAEVGERFIDDYPLSLYRTIPCDWGTIFWCEITDNSTVENAVDIIKADPRVWMVEPNYLGYFTEEPYFPNDPLWEGSDPGDDPRDSVYDQWGPAKLGSSIVWNESNGDDDVIVAVIDTGIRLDHEDLQTSLWINVDEDPENGIDDDENGWVDDWIGWDTFDQDNDPSDSGSHGTGCAGIIAAVQDNYKGCSGIAPGVKIMAIRADMWDGPTCVATVCEAWDYAKTNGADIVSMSFLVLYPTDVLRVAAEDTWDGGNGPILMAAAGNYDNTVQYVPASYDCVICVGATVPWSYYNEPVDEDRIHRNWEGWWWGSNYGDNLDIMGFGEKTITTYSSSPSAYRTGYQNGFFNGTSCACPTTAGVMALIKSFHPDYGGQWYWDRIEETADDLNVPGYDIQTGHGRVNALRAVYGPDRYEDLEDEDGFVPLIGLENTLYDSIHDRPTNPYHDPVDLYRITPEISGCLEIYLDIFTFGEDIDIALFSDDQMTDLIADSTVENHATSSWEWISVPAERDVDYFLSVYSPEIGNSTTYGLTVENTENEFNITPEDLAPTEIHRGDNDIPFLKLTFDIHCAATLDQLMVYRNLDQFDGRWYRLGLFVDANGNGIFDGEDQKIPTQADQSFYTFWFNELDLYWTSDAPMTIFITVSIPLDAEVGNTIYLSFETPGDIVLKEQLYPDPDIFPIESGVATITG